MPETTNEEQRLLEKAALLMRETHVRLDRLAKGTDDLVLAERTEHFIAEYEAYVAKRNG